MKREVLRSLVDEIRNFLDNEIATDDWEEKAIIAYTPNHRYTADMLFVVSYSQSFKIEKERTLKSAAYRKFNERVRASESYSNFVTSLGDRRQDGLIILYRLYAKIVHDRKRCEEIIEIALAEINDIPVVWKCKVFLQGLRTERPISAGNLMIRPIDVSDLPAYRGVPDFQPPIPIQSDLIFNASSVITFEIDDIVAGLKGLSDVVNRINLMLSKLRVSKGGDWVSTAWFAESEWVTEYSRFSNPFSCPERPFMLSPEQGVRKLPISTFISQDGQKFTELESEVFPNLTHEWRSFKKIHLALQMFAACVQRPIEEKLLFSIFGLEALYLAGGTELKLRLAIRTGMLMELLGYDRAIVYRDVLDAYSFRSNFVHGTKIDSSGLDEVMPRIMEYLRLSLLVWLEVERKKSVMNDFLGELESAAMDSKKHELINTKFIKGKLEKSLKRNMYCDS
jgi:hypothetical protein